MEKNEDPQKQKKDIEILARRGETTDGEIDHFDLLFTCHYQFFHKYIYQDAKSNDEFSMNVYDKSKQQMLQHPFNRPVLDFTLYERIFN